MSKSKPVTTTTSSQTTLPEWLTSAAQKVAGDVTGMPNYAPYTGEFAAPLVNNQLMAVNRVPGLLGAGANIASSALPGLTNANTFAAPQLDAGKIGADTTGLLNPFTKNVVDTTSREIDRSRILQQQQNDSRLASEHVFNGDRAGVVQAMNDRDFNTIKANTIASLYNNGFNTAQNAALDLNKSNQNATINSAGVNVASGNALAGLTNAFTGANASDIAGLLSTGGVAQQTQQLGDTAKYQDYLTQYNSMLQKLGLSASALGALPHGSSTEGTSTTTAQSSLLGPILGLGLGLMGLPGGSIGSSLFSSVLAGPGGSGQG